MYEHCRAWEGLAIISRGMKEWVGLYDWGYVDGHEPLKDRPGYELTNEKEIYVTADDVFVMLNPREGLTIDVAYFVPEAVRDLLEISSIVQFGHMPTACFCGQKASVVVASDAIPAQQKTELEQQGVIGAAVTIPRKCAR
jgi:hypothetical protein